MKESITRSISSDFREVNKSPLNDSLSKNLWTFSRDSRFVKEAVYCDNIYNLGTFVQPKKGTALGYGNKSDFTQDLTASPGSTRYEKSSQFEDNKTKKKGYSISIGRDLSTHKGHIELEPLKVPGPGAYDTDHPKGILYTMRKKLKSLDKSETVIEPQNHNPGPGTYENPEATEADGKYYISKFHDSGARFFNPQSSPRFSHLESKVPGPGTYVREQNNLSTHGRYILSKNRGQGRRAFDHQARRSFVDEYSRLHANPGPGSYRSPSDFGYYDKK